MVFFFWFECIVVWLLWFLVEFFFYVVWIVIFFGIVINLKECFLYKILEVIKICRGSELFKGVDLNLDEFLNCWKEYICFLCNLVRLFFVKVGVNGIN